MNLDLLDLIGERDATKWAKAFVSTVGKNPLLALDEQVMLTWFANAIMSGYDSGVKDTKTQIRPDTEVSNTVVPIIVSDTKANGITGTINIFDLI